MQTVANYHEIARDLAVFFPFEVMHYEKLPAFFFLSFFLSTSLPFSLIRTIRSLVIFLFVEAFKCYMQIEWAPPTDNATSKRHAYSLTCSAHQYACRTPKRMYRQSPMNGQLSVSVHVGSMCGVTARPPAIHERVQCICIWEASLSLSLFSNINSC